MTTDYDANCGSESAYDTALYLWSNFTKLNSWHGNDSLFESYVCHFTNYWTFKDVCAICEGYTVVILGALGFFGALFTALTLGQSQFHRLDFKLFQTVAYLEIIQLADVTAMTAFSYFGCEFYYTCSFIWAHLATSMANICSDAVDLIALYLSVERTVACIFPAYFRRLHSLGTYRMVELSCVVFPAIFSVLQAFELVVKFDQEADRYVENQSEFSQTPFYAAVVVVNMVRLYLTTLFIVLATLTSVLGFLSVDRRRKKLQTSVRKRMAEDERKKRRSDTAGPLCKRSRVMSMVAWSSKSKLDRSEPQNQQRNSGGKHKRQTDLCCLQLCLAVPVVINLMLYASGLTLANHGYVTGRDVFFTNITYEHARQEVTLAWSFQYLRTATNISNVLAHALHFYLYLLFSLKVRQGFTHLIGTCFSCACGKRKAQKNEPIRAGHALDTLAVNGERTYLMQNSSVVKEPSSVHL